MHKHHDSLYDYSKPYIYTYKQNGNEQVLIIALVITLIFMVIEVAGGIWANSLILIADAGHMLIDSSALIISFIAILIAKQPADSKNSYGYKRIQVIAAFINSSTLLFTTIWIIYESILRILEPKPITGILVTIFAIIGVIVNLIVIFLLNKRSRNDINIKSALIHAMGDLFGYIAAIIAGFIITYTDWVQIDPILSIFFSLLMIRSAIHMIKESLNILMEAMPDHLNTEEICTFLKQNIIEIIDIHHVHIWALTNNSLLLTAHIKIKDLKHSAKVIKTSKQLLNSHFNI